MKCKEGHLRCSCEQCLSTVVKKKMHGMFHSLLHLHTHVQLHTHTNTIKKLCSDGIWPLTILKYGEHNIFKLQMFPFAKGNCFVHFMEFFFSHFKVHNDPA